MRPPFLNKKIKLDFARYFIDFAKSFKKNLIFHRKRNNRWDIFKVTYPLFVLLEALSNFEYYLDPTKRILINEYIINKNKEELIKLLSKLSINDEKSDLIKKGMKKITFTPYFEELYSDILMLLNNYYMNNYRGCYIAIRCILEDLYRHLYYKDHIQEFYTIENIDDEYKIGLAPKKFREYLSKTSYLEKFTAVNKNFLSISPDDNDKFNVFEWNNNLYSKASSYVHASKSSLHNNYKMNSDLSFKENEAKKVLEFTEDIISLNIIFLISAHLEFFIRFNDYEKSIILTAFKGERKYAFRNFVNV